MYKHYDIKIQHKIATFFVNILSLEFFCLQKEYVHVHVLRVYGAAVMINNISKKLKQSKMLKQTECMISFFRIIND